MEEAGESQVQNHAQLHIQFEDRPGYLKPCLKNKGKRIQTNKNQPKASLTTRKESLTSGLDIHAVPTGPYCSKDHRNTPESTMTMDLWLGNWHGGRCLLGEEGLHLLNLWKLSLPRSSKSVGPCGHHTKAKQSAMTHLFLLKEIK